MFQNGCYMLDCITPYLHMVLIWWKWGYWHSPGQMIKMTWGIYWLDQLITSYIILYTTADGGFYNYVGHLWIFLYKYLDLRDFSCLKIIYLDFHVEKEKCSRCGCIGQCGTLQPGIYYTLGDTTTCQNVHFIRYMHASFCLIGASYLINWAIF